MAERFAIEPPESSSPCASAGYAKRSHSQRTTFSSICTAAGLGCQSPT